MINKNVMSRTISHLHSLEQVFVRLIRKIQFTKYLLNPVNIKEEEKAFWANFDQGCVYNPQYKYQKLPAEQIAAIQELKQHIPELIEKSRQLDSNPLTKAFLELITEELDTLSLLGAKRDQAFAQRLKDLYGMPPPELVREAEQILISYTQDVEAQEDTFTSSEFANLITKALQHRNLNWKVIEEHGLGSRFSVVSSRREVKVRAGGLFSEKDLLRFKVHEVGTHILRTENGHSQPLEMFEVGLSDYLETEEGLATVMEERNKILSSSLLKKYAGRVLAANQVEHSFYTIVSQLLEYFERHEAFEIAHRIKRGLSDTSQAGGFSKDYIYLSGRNLVKDYLSSGGEIERLYLGKIAVNHVTDMWNLVESGILIRPKQFPMENDLT